MKRIFFALCILAVVVSAPRQAKAETDVSIDFFYNNMGDDGSWVDVGDYGYCWQPNVAVSNSKWRPYSDGYWAYTDVGWTWISNERFGWATYHYGRWTRLRGRGWVWVPGREWGPAWVSWRTGGDYVGWAPLPPRRGGVGEVVYEGRPVDSRVDIDFDIGPAYYNFVDVRYIGEPVLRDRIFEPTQNVVYINNTVNVTNITYSNSRFYNHGPDYNRLSAYSTRPIRRMTLEREAKVDFATAGRNGGFTRVQGDRLVVAAPQQLQAQSPQQQLAPKAFKPRIAKPEVETGWMEITDPKAKAELQQKIKKEDPKSIPPAKIQPTNPAALTAAPVNADATPPLGGTTAPVAGPTPLGIALPGTDPQPVVAPNFTPNGKGRGGDKNKRAGNKPVAQPLVSQPDGTPTPDAPAVSMPNENKGKGKGRGKMANEQSGSPVVAPDGGSVTAPAAETSLPAKPDRKGKNKTERGNPAELAVPAAVPDRGGFAGETTVPPSAPRGNGKGKGKRPAITADSAAPQAGDNVGEMNRVQRKPQRMAVPPSDPGAAAASAPSQALPRQQAPSGKRRMQQAPPQQVAPSNGQPAPQQGGGKPGKGKKSKQGEQEPAATPAQ